MRALLAMSVLFPALPLIAAEKPVPVVEEPMHKVVFENDYVRVIDVQIPAGEISLYHIHVIPSIVVYLTRSTNRSEGWPDKAIVTRDVAPGQSRYAPYDTTPLTHRVTNTGTGLFRVFDIELLKKPIARDPIPPVASPRVKPHWDEKLARSSSVQLEAGAKVDVPASPCAVLLVGINGALELTPTPAKSGAHRTLKWGDYQFLPAQTRIEISNTGGEKAEAVLLELKD